MNIDYYTEFFHDGLLHTIKTNGNTIKTNGNTIEISMESNQIFPEWNKDNIALSKLDILSGSLILEGIIEIKEDDVIVPTFALKSGYEKADIYRFRTNANTVSLVLYWLKYLPEYQESYMFIYQIQGEKIYWKNDPSLSNNYWDSLED